MGGRASETVPLSSTVTSITVDVSCSFQLILSISLTVPHHFSDLRVYSNIFGRRHEGPSVQGTPTDRRTQRSTVENELGTYPRVSVGTLHKTGTTTIGDREMEIGRNRIVYVSVEEVLNTSGILSFCTRVQRVPC